MSAPTTTATVETLTAEVHVLRVGNRQITIGVAKQLDVIPFDRLRPFGRVNLGGSTYDINVIGADKDSGALCRAQVRNVPNEPGYAPRYEQCKAAKALPLIVLAGLR